MRYMGHRERIWDSARLCLDWWRILSRIPATCPASRENTSDLQALREEVSCMRYLGERSAYVPCSRALWKMKEQVNLSPKTAF